MKTGTILFVHGTGERLRSQESFPAFLHARAKHFGIGWDIEPCLWGDAVGTEFIGKSLPDPPEENERERQQTREWSYYDADPLFGLRLLSLPDSGNAKGSLGGPPVWELAWEKIRAYVPSDDLDALLDRGALNSTWPAAWGEILGDPVVKEAFQASGDNTADPSRALAEGVIARLVTLAEAPVSRATRGKLIERLRVDWQADVRGVGTLVSKFIAAKATSWLRTHRSEWSNAASLKVGDILLYQTRGEHIRLFLAARAAKLKPPVVLLAHSLGGVACVDLMASPAAPTDVRGLITAGSQAPLFHELGALSSIKEGADLPERFPNWLNFYDRNDFLSYVGRRMFSRVTDVEVKSGLSFPESHSGYWSCDETWLEIGRFLQDG